MIADLSAQGWKFSYTKSGHYRARPPEGMGGLIHISGTPSDRRALLNMKAMFRRAGAVLA